MRLVATRRRVAAGSGIVVLGLAILLAGELAGGRAVGTGAGPSPGPGSPAQPSPAALASETPVTPATHAEAIVPVTDFRAAWTSTDAAEVAAVLAGKSGRYTAVELVRADAPAVLAALGEAAPAPSDGRRIVLAPDPATLRSDLDRHPDRLGFLPADDVEPSVRALAWGTVSLFGVDRVRSLDNWPLAIQAAGPGTPGYDPGTAWTLVAAGDIMLDRLVAYAVKVQGLGVDFPFAGGSAVITGRTCCNPAGNPMPIGRRTGDAGAVRELLSGADLALANFENAAPNQFAYHATGFTFTADPALIRGLRDAGIDWVSVANNHIRNAGALGLVQTLQNLDRWGIAHSGAGATLAAARQASFFEVGGITVAILGYDTIRPGDAATATRPGTNEMTAARVRADVAAAREAGADLVIVFPHWGVEYTARTTATQRALAHAAIDAGADIVIGSHPHWAGGVEVYKGRPIFYCLGDFVFDIDVSEQTLEGIVPEMTFEGTRLVQVRIRPYLILDDAQPNWLDPAGSGAVVMRQVFAASSRLPW